MAARRDFSHSLRLRRSSSFSFSLQNRLQFTYYAPMENSSSSSSSSCSRRPNRKLLMIEMLSRRPPPNLCAIPYSQSIDRWWLLNIIIIVRKTFAKAAEKSKEEVFGAFSLFSLFRSSKKQRRRRQNLLHQRKFKEYICRPSRAFYS